jgi:hypothetical protein
MDKMIRNGAKVIVVRFTGGQRQEHRVYNQGVDMAYDLFTYLELTCRG